jgi:hypothetical protein
MSWDQRILELTVEAHHLDSEARQAILKEIAQLRQLEAWPLIAAVQASIPAATTPRQL